MKQSSAAPTKVEKQPIVRRFSALAKEASPALLGSLLHAGLIAVSLPGIAPVGVSIVAAFLALLPLLWVVKGRGSLAALFVGVWLGQVPLWVLQQWWVLEVSEFGFFPFVALMACYAPLFVLLARVARERVPGIAMPLVAAVLWAGIEFFRARLFLGGYAWGLSGDALIDAPALAAPARVGGAPFVAFLMMLVVAGAWRAVAGREEQPPRRAAGTGCIVVGVVAWFLCCMTTLVPSNGGESAVSIAVVQTNVPQSNKIGWTITDEVRDFRRFTELTRRAAAADNNHKDRPSLIVWPETMMPGMTLEPAANAKLRDFGVFFRVPAGVLGKEETQLAATAFVDEVLSLQKELGVPMLIGEEGIEGLSIKDGPEGRIDFEQQSRFNSTYLVMDGAVQPSRYDKIHLTPFGEVMPVISRWDWLENKLLAVAAGGMRFDLAEGSRRTVFSIPAPEVKAGSVRVVTPICFESTDSALCRSLVFDRSRRADVIVNLTNDGWFGESDLARRQHLRAARWRAFELITPVVRAANTGISAAIDDDGRVVKQVAPHGDGVLCAQVVIRPQAGLSFYARFGDWCGWCCLVGTVSLVFIGLRGLLPWGRRSESATHARSS